jgi:transcriptional regulator with XRE-family HTH domain
MTHKRWINISSEALREARIRKDLSYEGIARLIPVASKTWMRWEKAGRVDAAAFERVVEILNLDVQMEAPPERVTVVVPERPTDGTAFAIMLDRRFAELQAEIKELKSLIEKALKKEDDVEYLRSGG